MDYLYSIGNRISKRPAAHREQNKLGLLGRFTVYRHGRFWAVRDASGDLVCLTVYKRGAEEVTRRLESQEASTRAQGSGKALTPGEK